VNVQVFTSGLSWLCSCVESKVIRGGSIETLQSCMDNCDFGGVTRPLRWHGAVAQSAITYALVLCVIAACMRKHGFHSPSSQ
jgi:hypothetical protein